MNVRLLYRGSLCRFLCVLLAIALATGPSAAAVAQQPQIETAQDDVQQPITGSVEVVEQPPTRTILNDTTLLAAPGAGKLDLKYVTPQAVALAVLHPRQLLTSPATALMPIEVVSAAGIEHLGIDPAEIEEIIAFAEPPSVVGLQYGAIIKFAKPIPLNGLPEKFRVHTQPAEIAGTQYLQSTHPQMPSLYMPDDRTLLVMPDSTLRKLLAPPAGVVAASPLLDRVRDLPGANDLYVVVDVATLRPLIVPWMNVAVMKEGDKFPAEAKPFLEIPNLVTAVDLTFNITTTGPTTLVLHANDAASADRLEALHALAKDLQRKELTKSVAQMQQSDEPIERAFGKYVERLSNVSADAYQPERQGDSLVLFQGFKQNDPVQRQLINVAVAGFLVALILPAIQAAREAARRNQSVNNMRQILLAALVYSDAKRTLPPHAIYSADGKPLLSWRVAILPYLDQNELYKQFKLDEPWDSEHNRALIAQMPEVYANPNVQEPGKTNYLAVVGKECIMDGRPIGMSFAGIRDGTSNTILFVEANADRAVEWTKPDDLAFDPTNPGAGMGDLRPGGSNVGWADGHVSFVSKDTDPQTLKAFITRNGHEVVEAQ